MVQFGLLYRSESDMGTVPLGSVEFSHKREKVSFVFLIDKSGVSSLACYITSSKVYITD